MKPKKSCWCGLEVDKDRVNVCLLGDGPDKQRRTFSHSPEDQAALSEWLANEGCTHIAINPAHENWKPLCNSLKKRFTVRVVNDQTVIQPRHTAEQHCCCEWLAELLRTGRLEKLDQVEPIGDRTAFSDEDSLGGQAGKGPEHSGEKNRR